MPKESGKKSKHHQSSDESSLPPPLTEAQLNNIQSVQFLAPVIKNIISNHSGSILSSPEPIVELPDTIEKKAKEIFQTFSEENGRKIHKSKLFQMVKQCGYQFLRDDDIFQKILKKFLPSSSPHSLPSTSRPHSPTSPSSPHQIKEEEGKNTAEEKDQDDSEMLDERSWLLFLEKYQAPAYYYGQRLRQYCHRGVIPEIIELIYRGCDINTGDGEGLTPLHYASEANYPEVIQTLHDLSSGGGGVLLINAQDKYGWTPLHSACHHGNIDCVKLLIHLGANVHLTEKVGKTPLHLAVAQARNGICDYLLANGANLNTPDSHGMTSLHEAAYKLNEKTYQLLAMTKGCNSQAVDCFGYSPERYLQLSNNPSSSSSSSSAMTGL